jgi:hypothetical protein
MRRELAASTLVVGALLGAALLGATAGVTSAKEKVAVIDANDPTYRLFQLLDSSRAGKLTGFYLIADVYKNPSDPNEELQHILRAEYDKDRGYAKLSLYVRSVGKIAPEQMKTYTAKDFYEFGLVDQEKYMKTEPGVFGRPGDIFLRAEGDRPLATAPITDEVRKAYEFYLTQHLLPALQKK